jgi:hypothetical protein
LGSVAIDVHRKERDYRHLTLSDNNVVKYLILFRSKVDVSYDANVNIDFSQAGDMFEFNQELIALYSSLDVMIKECGFKQKQNKLLSLIFEGHTITDICNMDIGYKSSATYDLLDRMVAKIVTINDKTWKKSMKSQGYITEDDLDM